MKARVFVCPDHRPHGISPEPFDDGTAACAICGSFGYHVKPFLMAPDVERVWRGITSTKKRSQQ